MSYHERLVALLARHLELEALPTVAVGPELRPSSNPATHTVYLPLESPLGRADLVHSAVHELVHLERGDEPIQADREASTEDLAAEAARWFTMELGVERRAIEAFPGVQPLPNYSSLFDPAARRAEQAAWALSAAVRLQLGHDAHPAPGWVIGLAWRAVEAARSGDPRTLAGALMEQLSREELLELLSRHQASSSRSERETRGPSEPATGGDQEGGDPLEHGGELPRIAWGPVPTDRPAPERPPTRGRLDAARVKPVAARYLRRAPGGGLAGRPAEALAQQSLFLRRPRPEDTLVLLDGSADALAQPELWDAAETLRELLPAGRVLAVRESCEAEGVTIRLLRDPGRQRYEAFCRGFLPVEKVLDAMSAGRLAAPRHLVVLHSWFSPWTERAEALADRLASRRGVRLSRVGAACWGGLVGQLMHLAELDCDDRVPCLSELQ